MIKKEIRIIAWDDCAFRFRQKSVMLVGAIFRGGLFMDGLLAAKIVKDGTDATDKIACAINKSRHYDQLSVIMLDGISFGGFNLVDIKKLSKKTKMPVIVIQRKKPDVKNFIKTLNIFKNHKERKETVRKAGRFYRFERIFYQKSGISKEDAESVLRVACVRSNVPEPIRVAHIIASGLSGESSGRA
jgi:hypothetical protein